ncbi:MAG: hypothetical protein AAF468_15955 [Pseudomonadota bacterium]
MLDKLKCLLGLGISAGAMSAGALDISLLQGSTQLLTHAGNLALTVSAESKGALGDIERSLFSIIAREHKNWLKQFAGGPISDDAVETGQAIDALPDALAKAQLSLQDVVDARGDGATFADTLIERLDKESLFRTSQHAANVLQALLSGLFHEARSSARLQPLFTSLQFDAMHKRFDQVDAGQRAILDALHTNYGVPIENLRPIFEAVKHDFPEGNFQSALDEAVAALIEQGKQPVDVGNSGADIVRILELVREKLKKADVDGAVGLLREERQSRALDSARLAREEAKILKTAYRWQEALDAYQDAARLDPTRPGDHYECGDIHTHRGDLEGAKAALEAGKSCAENNGLERDIGAAFDRLGDLAIARGDLEVAQQSLQYALDTAEGLVKSDPGNAQWQRDLSVSHNKIGNLAIARGDLETAKKAYQDALGIRDRLAKSDPGNAGWQRDLSVSHERIGDLAVKRGDPEVAEEAYQDALDIMVRLAKSDLGNAGWQRDLSVSHNKIGELAVARDDLEAAQRAFQDALDIADRLAKSDPGNAGWQRDLSVSHNKIGDLAVARGDLEAAQEPFQASLNIRDRLAKSDPGNAGWQRDLSVSHNKIGDLAVARGDLEAAKRTFKDALDIADQLARSDPGNAEWQRDLIISYVKLSQVEQNAVGRLQQALEIAERLMGEGRLAPRDHWMVDDLKQRVATTSQPS